MNKLVLIEIVSVIVTLAVILCFGLLKIHNANEQQYKIGKAIVRYRIDCIEKGEKPFVFFYDIEDLYYTVGRFWDWGYTRILPRKSTK
jgi:hypothetical protein